MAKQKRSERMKVLLKLAQMREDSAARTLAENSEKLQQAQRQGQQLALYNREYQQQYATRAGQAMSMRDLRNFQGFFQQLDNVQTQQQNLVAQRDEEREQARLQWVQLYNRRRVLDQIRERSRNEEEAVHERKLQAEFDDRAARHSLMDSRRDSGEATDKS
ncbi:MAG: flagellar export protein FliJ [Spongiibacteraceae bacterium]